MYYYVKIECQPCEKYQQYHNTCFKYFTALFFIRCDKWFHLKIIGASIIHICSNSIFFISPILPYLVSWENARYLSGREHRRFYLITMQKVAWLPCQKYASQYYIDVIMSAMAPQITGVSMVCSIVCSGADQRKHQSSGSLAFARGIHRWPVNSPHKGSVTRKMCPLDDVIMKLGIHVWLGLILTRKKDNWYFTLAGELWGVFWKFFEGRWQQCIEHVCILRKQTEVYVREWNTLWQVAMRNSFHVVSSRQ